MSQHHHDVVKKRHGANQMRFPLLTSNQLTFRLIRDIQLSGLGKVNSVSLLTPLYVRRCSEHLFDTQCVSCYVFQHFRSQGRTNIGRLRSRINEPLRSNSTWSLSKKYSRRKYQESHLLTVERSRSNDTFWIPENSILSSFRTGS